MSRKSNHVTRPSGLRQSADGKYVYANCVVTGRPTFFKPDYFANVLARDFNGNENKMAKGYVCKDVKTLRKSGKTDEQILKMLGKFDPKAPKVKKHPKQKEADAVIKPKREKRNKIATTPVGEVVVVKATPTAKPVTRPVYPWSDNPNYFRSENAGAINFEEATKDTCHRPDLYLDTRCEGCPLYDRCTLDSKWTEETRKSVSKQPKAPVVHKINLVAGCFDTPAKAE